MVVCVAILLGSLALLRSVARGQEYRAIEAGIKALERKDYVVAEQAFQSAVTQDPKSALAYKLLGLTFGAQKKYRLAEGSFHRACELDPNEENACYYLALTYYNLSQFEKSKQTFEAVTNTASPKDRLQAGLAITLEALGRTNEAEHLFQEAIHEGRRETLTLYGMFLFRQGRLTESITVLRRAQAFQEVAQVERVLAAAPTNRRGTASALPVHFQSKSLPMVVKNGALGEKHQVETMLAGVAVLDYDNDGWPDIFIANGAEVLTQKKTDASFYNRLFHNNHDGTFTDVTEKAGLAGEGYSMGVAAADYDNDGWVDLFVTGVRSNHLYHNRGDGTFEDVTDKARVKGDGRWAVAAGWFDYDNDGRLDLFVVNYVAWDPGKEPFCGDSRPAYRGYCPPQEYAPLANQLYRNLGNGVFRDVSVESGIGSHLGKGMGVSFGDIDNDGFLDIFVANDTEPNSLFHNLRNGTFEEIALNSGVAYNGDGRAISSMGADFRDLDNDGLDDIVVTSITNQTFSVFRNVGNGQFVDISQLSRIASLSLPLSGWSAGVYDFNNDGYKDIFSANGHAEDNAELTSDARSRQTNTVFLNRGDGTFSMEELPGAALHRGAAFGDFNRDGRMDVIVTRLNESPLILENTTQTSNHWLGVKLRGHHSNRDGIGARIHIVTESGTSQWNRVTTSVGYAGSSEPVAHFGLGRDRTVKLLEVQWPSGAKQTLENLEVDRYLLIEERP